ncbi:MAG: hypothetical protein M1834_008882 [Cirrosporium novae-zelandiae]|nr:MAG: hypothetical protein M1834_008882 [Cirrosporium novae-zelandiae]
MSRVGRRALYLYGLAILFILALLIGTLATLSSSTSVSWAIGSMLLMWQLVYDLTIGPVSYSLVAEIPSARLRQKTIILARNLYNICGIVNGIWMPYIFNPTTWNWGAKTVFFWGGGCFLCLVWTFFRFPEPKGKMYGELDILFEKHVSAREFETSDITEFDR